MSEKVRKPLEQMIAEINTVRKMMHKTYKHKKSGQHYTLMMAVFDEATNELMAVYCLVAWTQLKFVRPMAEFIEKFEESKA